MACEGVRPRGSTGAGTSELERHKQRAGAARAASERVSVASRGSELDAASRGDRGRERTRTGEELLCTLSRAEVLCSSQAGGCSLVPAAVQPRLRLVVAARGAPGPGSLRPWLVIAGEGGGCSGGRRPRVAARVARGGAGRAAARGGVGVGQQGLYAPLGGLEAGPYLVDQIRIQSEVFRPNTAQLVDTSRIRIHDVSDTYPYPIHIGYAIRHQTAVSV